ncbi:DUF732 domain-containing protein [Mycobacterium sp. MMS18-G62]
MIKPLCAAAAICALGVVFAPAAYAITTAEADYIQDLNSAGIGGDEAGLIADGHTVCAAIAAGHDPNTLSQTYYDNAVNLSHAQADAAVNLAVKDLCPTG